MTAKKYNVIFSGKILRGSDIDLVRKKLAHLFKTDITKIRSIFRTDGSIIKQNVDRETALKYVKVIRSAGAICSIAEIKPATGAPKTISGTARPAKQPSQKQRVFPLKPGASRLAYSPIACNRITGVSGGMDLNRNDRERLSYHDIVLISVFKEMIRSEEHFRLLLFLRGEKRPFIVDDHLIAYADFPVQRGMKTESSLRNFLKFLCSKNSDIIMDEHTHAFLSGRTIEPFNDDVTVLTTALAKIIETVLPVTQIPEAEEPVHPEKRKLTRAEGKNKAKSALEIVMKQQRAVAKSEPRTAYNEEDAWIKVRAFIFGMMLLAGFAWPLLKHSMLFGSAVLVWPWNLMGFGTDRVLQAATATVSGGGTMVIWALLPFFAGITVVIIHRFLSFTFRAMVMFVTGMLLLVLLLVILIDEAEILGLLFTPPTAIGGVIIVVIVCAAALVAVANHLRKTFTPHIMPRVLSGVGAFMLGTLVVLAFFAGSGAWKTWPMILLYTGMLGYAALGALSAFRRLPTESLISWISMSSRIMLFWAPLACLISQTHSGGAYAEYVMEGGGGFLHNLMSFIKLFLICYGSAFTMATGLAGILFIVLFRRVA